MTGRSLAYHIRSFIFLRIAIAFRNPATMARGFRYTKKAFLVRKAFLANISVVIVGIHNDN